MEKILRFIYGYLTVTIRGKEIERFLNLCRKRRIFLRNIRYTGECQVMAQMPAGDFFLLKPVRNKTGVHIHIEEKYGMPFFFFRNKKRKAFFAGILLGSILLMALTGRIWNIHISGNRINSTAKILEFLGEQGVRHAMKRKDVNCAELASEVRKQFPEITWVSARIEGVRLVLEIQESTEIPEMQEEILEKPCNLEAGHDGRIVQMIVRSGIPVKKVGDICEAGETLVSGELPVMNDSQEIEHYEYVHADADIFISRSVAYYREIPLEHEIRKETGEKKHRFFIRAGSWYLEFCEKTDANWKKFCEEIPVYLTENFKLPLSLGKIEMVRYRLEARTYTQKEAEQKASVYLQQYEKKLLEQGITIAENHVTVTMAGRSCISKGTLKIIEKTGQEAKINKNREKETKK